MIDFQETSLSEVDGEGWLEHRPSGFKLVEANPAKKFLKGLYILDEPSLDLIYGSQEQREVAALVDLYAPPQTADSIKADPSVLADADVIFSGWGAPVMDEAFLQAASKLRAVFYAAGSIRSFTTEAFWDRNIVVTSAYAANAIPVAEYTLSVILLSLKLFWRYSSEARMGHGWGDHTRPVPGSFKAKVGLVSCGMVARATLKFLESFDIERLVHCPFLSEAGARELNVRLCTLPELFREADVVSLHTPVLPATRGLITGRLISSMKPNATLINTARGAIIKQSEMIEVLRKRTDLTAVLDVTDPEPPAADCQLLALPNVVVTPHIAGSMGTEINRLGRYIVDELHRYIAGQPLKWQITRELAATLA